ncbi:hypothetical protein HED60_17715 [Planctomycetales bacterium ZRK34]|nr:hypothetical protein HED60_17715 [Planctomycetales bacterium ZRK34]
MVVDRLLDALGVLRRVFGRLGNALLRLAGRLQTEQAGGARIERAAHADLVGLLLDRVADVAKPRERAPGLIENAVRTFETVGTCGLLGLALLPRFFDGLLELVARLLERVLGRLTLGRGLGVDGFETRVGLRTDLRESRLVLLLGLVALLLAFLLTRRQRGVALPIDVAVE